MSPFISTPKPVTSSLQKHQQPFGPLVFNLSTTRSSRKGAPALPRLDRCFARWRHYPEASLPPRGCIPTLIFIKYPDANMLEPMFYELRHIAANAGFNVVRHSVAANLSLSLRIMVNYEEPNRFFIETKAGHLPSRLQELRTRESAYDHCLTMCPYTAQWVNTLLHRCTRTPLWQAVPTKELRPFIPFTQRRHDIIYMASHSHHGPVCDALQEVFPHFNYRWATDRRVKQLHRLQPNTYKRTFSQRMQVTRHTRTALIVNTLFYSNKLKDRQQYHLRPLLYTHGAFEAFKTTDRNQSLLCVPQLKSRTFEAAASGALMLVYEDGFNIIENFYTPVTEFLYWRTTAQLRSLLEDVLVRPNVYEPIARRAYERTWANYSVKAWVRLLVRPFVDMCQRP
eukprot:NODE_1767_length_1389_cov_50.113312_g1678_i0.p1 GENE.NODE_1767_length_1389_cov_50.113312_g1678_i0~~NODE_1767_length_1389_cov_50.113312_g1678_i0.p1  ORF type:complete len:431 (-),score=81.42 NODE_1767_length_1389_cov_50.113312_g1678_i0:95-1282(-)